MDGHPALPTATILLVDDDRTTARLIARGLELSGYRVECAETAAEAEAWLAAAAPGGPDLIVLDLILPDRDGLVLCADLKARADTPIVVCSGTARKHDAVLAFKVGADDFVAKPFNLDELKARVQAVLQRTARRRVAETAPPAGAGAAAPPAPPERAERRTVGALAIDHPRRAVTLGGAPVPVTPTEYRLLRALAERVDEVLTRDELAQLVWDNADASIGRAIDVHVRRLRAKLAAAAAGAAPPPPIVAVRGFGYKLAGPNA